MALAKQTQVALATVAVFVVSLAGLFAFSLGTVTGRTGVTTTAESEQPVVSLSFEPAELAGKAGDQAVVDILMEGSTRLVGANLSFQFDQELVAVREVNSEGGIFGQASTAFDFDNGLLTLSFTPGRAIKPSGRIVTLILDLKTAGSSALRVVEDGSELSLLTNGILKKQHPFAATSVAIEVASP